MMHGRRRGDLGFGMETSTARTVVGLEEVAAKAEVWVLLLFDGHDEHWRRSRGDGSGGDQDLGDFKVLESLNRLTTINFYPHNRCGTKKRTHDYKIKRK